MSTLARPGAAINFEVWGDAGPWATLVNGHTRPLNDFRMLGKHLVEKGRRVLALDNRGAGLTTVERGFTLPEMADDVAALWRELGVSSGGLLGISMGGFIAETVAMAYPEKVEKLVLVSTAMNQRKIRVDDRPWSTEFADNEAKLAPYFTKAFAERNAVLVKSMVKQITKNVVDGRFSENSELQKAASKGFDAKARIEAGGIRAPTLVVHGEEDEIIPFSAAEETLAALRRGGVGAELERFADAGHLLLAERPRELYATVARWFG